MESFVDIVYLLISNLGHSHLSRVAPDRYVTFDNNISSLIMYNINKHLIARYMIGRLLRQLASSPAQARALTRAPRHNHGWNSSNDCWSYLYPNWSCNKSCRRRSDRCLCYQWNNHIIYSHGICRARFSHARSWWWLSVGRRRASSTKCLYQWMDGVARSYSCRKPLCCRICFIPRQFA